jgi:hypothetical protein
MGKKEMIDDIIKNKEGVNKPKIKLARPKKFKT